MMILGLSLSACGGAEGGNRAEQLALDIRGEYLETVSYTHLYILSEDPTYITNYNNARALIRKLDRDELLQELVKQYLRD